MSKSRKQSHRASRHSANAKAKRITWNYSAITVDDLHEAASAPRTPMKAERKPHAEHCVSVEHVAYDRRCKPATIAALMAVFKEETGKVLVLHKSRRGVENPSCLGVFAPAIQS